MSAIKKNEMDTTRGVTTKRIGLDSIRREPYPINRLQQIPMAAIRAQAAVGIRFHQAACVYPCELSTSFIPESMSDASGFGCASAGPRTADHRFVCSCEVAALISCSRRASRVL